MGEKIAGRGGNPGAAGEDRLHHSCRPSTSHEAMAWKHLRRGLRRLKDRPLRLVVDLKPTAQALADPVFGPHVAGMVIECGASAVWGGDCECFGCRARWAPGRAVKVIGLIEFIDLAGQGGVIGLCAVCWSQVDVMSIIAKALERDLGRRNLEVMPLPQGGNA